MTRPRGKPPAFQFYAGDWLIGTRALGPYGRGVYIDLLALQWATGELDDDAATVAAMVGADEATVLALWPRLRAKFATGSPGKMINVRLEVEREKLDAFREEQANKGRASAEARRNRSATTVQPSVNHGSTEPQPGGQPKVNSSSSSSFSSSTTSTEKDLAQAAPERVDLLPVEKLPRFDLDALYRAYPRKQGKAAGMAAIKKAIKTEADYQAHRRAIAYLLQHITRDGLDVSFLPYWSTWVKGVWRDYENGIPVPPPTKPAPARGSFVPPPDKVYIRGEQ